MTDDPKPDAMSDGAVEVAAAGAADPGVAQANVAEVFAAPLSAIPPDEMALCDWSSDVCSSDLLKSRPGAGHFRSSLQSSFQLRIVVSQSY